MKYKIGHSMDIHALVDDRPLKLGGIEIPHNKGLLGHSDADCLLHAIAEAIIGALGIGDIGTHFPDSEDIYRNIDSKILLKKIFILTKKNGYLINNLDSTIYAEKPIMAPYIPKMRSIIAEILEADVQLINIKATRGEKIGFVGREEGIACEAVVMLRKCI